MDDAKSSFIGNIIGLSIFLLIMIGLIVLKAFNLIALSWALVLLPICCCIGISVLITLIILVMLIIDLFTNKNEEDDISFK